MQRDGLRFVRGHASRAAKAAGIGAILSLGLGSACTSDPSAPNQTELPALVPSAPPVGGAAGMPPVIAPAPPAIDAAPPPEVADAAPNPGAGPDADLEPAGPSPFLGRCQRDADCEQGLICREGSRGSPGYCTRHCTSPGDCGEPEASCSTTSVPGVCFFPCSALGDPCPLDLTCQPLLTGTFRCGHEPPPVVGPFERCSQAANNCGEGYLCYRTPGSPTLGAGYCAPTCGGGNDCEDHQPAGVTAELGCAGGVCRFACETGTCPAGMECELIESEDQDPIQRCNFTE